jgi:OmpA-OmpF porin, OOP family
VLVFSPDGKSMLGLWWREGETNGPGDLWHGQKIDEAVGSCPHWKPGSPASQLAIDLAATGRVRVYGINFDLDSAQIRADSKAALDGIVRLAKEKPEWTFTIEGHTDATASSAYNQTLSEQRAAAVKQWLHAAGVAAARLGTKGLGATRPVSDNGTAFGRAQNRRVELVKN